ncbi:hypothetical protein [Bacillus sp. CECT 9360]|uniref:hypothetical protein n=1 Tax=Bacillus sp. CECT 9360 TaxID=2845821 RepID=UPI001E3D28A2|nr:hypothetical protein [Bacillus sp. CECT 9360]CAH0345563.1 hypothetical protein BCI9360_01851 [Bacillus sp. CECT 9360]
MKRILAFETAEEVHQYQSTTDKYMKKLEDYQRILTVQFQLNTLPKGVIWTSTELATTFYKAIRR